MTKIKATNFTAKENLTVGTIKAKQNLRHYVLYSRMAYFIIVISNCVITLHENSGCNSKCAISTYCGKNTAVHLNFCPPNVKCVIKHLGPLLENDM